MCTVTLLVRMNWQSALAKTFTSAILKMPFFIFNKSFQRPMLRQLRLMSGAESKPNVQRIRTRSIEKVTRILSSLIQTGSIARPFCSRQRGEVDGILVFGCLIFLQLFVWNSLRVIAGSWANTIAALNEDDGSSSFSEFEAFGEDWPRPLARIDYGAYHQKKRDAEALCIVGRSILSEQDYANLDCE